MAKTSNRSAAQPTPNSTKERAERGPSLVWNQSRDQALVSSLYDGERRLTNAEVAEVVREHQAFANVPEGAITPAKIGLRLGKLRKAGVPVPRASRTRVEMDTEALTSLLPQSVVASASAE